MDNTTPEANATPEHEEEHITMEMEESIPNPTPKPWLTRLRLALAPYTVHFKYPGYMKEDTLRRLEWDVVKKTLEETRKNYELRYASSSFSMILQGIFPASASANPTTAKNSRSLPTSGTTYPPF